MHVATIDPASPVVPECIQLKSDMDAVEQIEGVIPISIMEMKFEYVSQPAVDNDFIFVQNDQIFQLPQTSVFAERNAVVLHIDAKDASEKFILFLFQYNTSEVPPGFDNLVNFL